MHVGAVPPVIKRDVGDAAVHAADLHVTARTIAADVGIYRAGPVGRVGPVDLREIAAHRQGVG